MCGILGMFRWDGIVGWGNRGVMNVRSLGVDTERICDWVDRVINLLNGFVEFDNISGNDEQVSESE